MNQKRERLVTKKDAAMRQITAAIEHHKKGDYECAITLAGAAEGQSATNNDDKNLFKQLKQEGGGPDFNDEKCWISHINAVRDWLKHETKNMKSEIPIDSFDSGLMIVRAISKFNWAYGQITVGMDIFQNELWEIILERQQES